MASVQVECSDLEKIKDVLDRDVDFHVHRDSMNAALHLAGAPRWSPLTSEVMAQRERLITILEGEA